MILDQISAMEPMDSDNPSDYTDLLRKGFDAVTGTIAGFNPYAQSSIEEQRATRGSIVSFMDRATNLADRRDGLLSSIDSSIVNQTRQLSNDIGELSNDIQQVSLSVARLESRFDSLYTVNSQILRTLQSSMRIPDITYTVDDGALYDIDFGSYFDDLNSTQLVVRESQERSIDVLISFRDSFNEYRDDFKLAMNAIGNRISAVITAVQHSGGTAQGLLTDISASSSSTSQNTDSSQADAAAESGRNGILGALRRILGGGLVLNGLNSLLGSFMANLDENYKNTWSKIAIVLGENARYDAFNIRRDAIMQGNERNNGRGHLGDMSKLISVQEYDEAINRALDMGVANADQLVSASSELALMNKLMPEVSVESEGYFKNLINGYEDGADRVRGTAMLMKKYSEDLWTTPSSLQTTVSKYHNAVAAMSKDLDSYVKTMDNFIRTKGRMDDAGLDLGIEGLRDSFADNAVSDWSADQMRQLSALGVNAIDFERASLVDPEAANQMIIDGVQQRMDKFLSEDGTVDYNQMSSDEIHMFKENAKLLGMSTQELAEAISKNGAIDRYERTSGVNSGEEITSAADMQSAIMDSANQTLTDQLNLTLGEEFKNVTDTGVLSLGVTSGILNWLDAHGVTSGEIQIIIGLLTAAGWNNISSGIRGIFNFVRGGGITNALNSARNFLNMGGLNSLIHNIGNAGRSFSSTIIGGARNFGNSLLNTGRQFGGVVSDTGRALRSSFSNIIHGGAGSAGGAGAGAANLSDDVASIIGNTSDDVARSAASVFDDISRMASSATDDISRLAANSSDDIARIAANSTDDVARLAAGSADDVARLAASSSDDIARGIGGLSTKATGALAAVGVALDAGLGVNKSEEWFGDTSNQSKIASFIGGALGGSGSGITSDESVGEKALNIGGGALKGAAVGAAVGSVVPVIGTAIGGAIGAGVGALGSAIGGENIAKFVSGIGDKLKAGNEKVDEFLEDHLGNFGKGISKLKNGYLEGLGDLYGGVASGIGDVAGGLVDGVGSAVSGIGSGLKLILTGHPIQGIQAAAGGLVTGVGEILTGIGKGLVDVGKGVWGFIKKTGKGILGFFKSLFGIEDDVEELEEEAKVKQENDSLSNKITEDDDKKINPYEDWTQKSASVTPMENSPYAYTDYEALRGDSLFTPSQNLANYDGAIDTSQIKVGYTNKDALLDGNLSLENNFADSVMRGTYGDLSDNLSLSDRGLGLQEEETSQKMQEVVDPLIAAVKTNNDSELLQKFGLMERQQPLIISEPVDNKLEEYSPSDKNLDSGLTESINKEMGQFLSESDKVDHNQTPQGEFDAFKECAKLLGASSQDLANAVSIDTTKVPEIKAEEPSSEESFKDKIFGFMKDSSAFLAKSALFGFNPKDFMSLLGKDGLAGILNSRTELSESSLEEATGTMKDLVKASALMFVNPVESVKTFANTLFNKDDNLPETSVKEEVKEPEQSTVVEAIQTLQENLVIRLDTLISSLNKKESVKAPKEADYTEYSVGSIDDQNILNYAR